MATSKADMQRLIDQRNRLLAEMEALKNKISGLEMAMGLLQGEDGTSSESAERPRRANVKGTILNLLREVGTTGLNAASTVEIAARRGIELDRGTVSSLLSRLKREGTIVYDGERYKLPEFARPTERPSVTVVQGGQSTF